mgnify:CR=1 FL=1
MNIIRLCLYKSSIDIARFLRMQFFKNIVPFPDGMKTKSKHKSVGSASFERQMYQPVYLLEMNGVPQKNSYFIMAPQ